MEKYQYQPLPNSSNQIRVLRVHPADSVSDPLVCDMWMKSLDDPGQYVALSYTWGPPALSHGITCNGRSLSITANLDGALRWFRESKWQMIWADAICIDQTNPAERSSQVLLMGRIYESCTMVLVHLGEEQEGDRQACELITALANLQNTARPAVQIEPHDYKDYGLPALDNPAWTARRKFYTRPWFTRIWVVQEMSVKKTVVAACGRLRFLLDYISRGEGLAFNHGIGRLDYGAEIDLELQRRAEDGKFSVRIMNELTIKRRIGVERKLIFLLEKFRRLQATDPRDKIYGILGLATDVEGAPSPNYALSVETVYIQYALFMISTGSEIEVLQAAGSHRSLLRIPTWVPDWTNSAEYYSYSIPRAAPFQAAGDSKASVTISPDHTRINVLGAFVDKISVLKPLFKHSLQSFEDIDVYYDWRPRDGVLERCKQLKDKIIMHVLEDQTSILIDSLPDHQVDPVSGFIDLNNYDKSQFLVKEAICRNALGTFTRNVLSNRDRPLPDSAMNMSDRGFFRLYETRHLIRRRLFLSEKGYVGLAPESSQEGDDVAIILGGCAPFILRKNNNAYMLVGETYVDGLMDGEALEMYDFIPEEILLC